MAVGGTLRRRSRSRTRATLSFGLSSSFEKPVQRTRKSASFKYMRSAARCEECEAVPVTRVVGRAPVRLGEPRGRGGASGSLIGRLQQRTGRRARGAAPGTPWTRSSEQAPAAMWSREDTGRGEGARGARGSDLERLCVAQCPHEREAEGAGEEWGGVATAGAAHLCCRAATAHAAHARPGVDWPGEGEAGAEALARLVAGQPDSRRATFQLCRESPRSPNSFLVWTGRAVTPPPAPLRRARECDPLQCVHVRARAAAPAPRFALAAVQRSCERAARHRLQILQSSQIARRQCKGWRLQCANSCPPAPARHSPRGCQRL